MGIELIPIIKVLGVVIQAIIIPGAIWAWKVWGGKVKDEKIRASVDAAVRAAEELGAAGQLTTSKQDYVWTFLETKYPGINKRRDEVDILINAAVQAAGVGFTGKKEIKKV